jgi:hypothetical protein
VFAPADSLVTPSGMAICAHLSVSIATESPTLSPLGYGAIPARQPCSSPVSDVVLPAAGCAKAIRHHWHIENRSHYVRDGSFAEDASRIHRNPGIFARLRSFAANILRFSAFITFQTDGIALPSAASVQSSPCASCIER